ncbi:MAG: GNAT family N-acetyltransferase [Candidatus Gastranaerophilales bacterium]|nr:GNAT family N-acetyltransferase [Candidatus Gastranaerophilales bacterium]
MNLKFDFYTDKNTLEDVDVSRSFEENIGESRKYAFKFFLDISDENYKVAKISGYILDDEQISEDEEDIIDIADMIDQDLYNAIDKLVNSDYFTYDEGYIAYLERFYIFPEYRNKGIGNFMLNNLDKILHYFLNIPIKCFITYLKPQIPTEKDWIDLKDTNKTMKKLMAQVFKTAGYKQIKKSDYYVKIYI